MPRISKESDIFAEPYEQSLEIIPKTSDIPPFSVKHSVYPPLYLAILLPGISGVFTARISDLT